MLYKILCYNYYVKESLSMFMFLIGEEFYVNIYKL